MLDLSCGKTSMVIADVLQSSREDHEIDRAVRM